MNMIKILSYERGKCPYCNSKDVFCESTDRGSDLSWVERQMYCNNCDRYYFEEYTLTFSGLEVGTDRATAEIGMEIEYDDD